LARTKYIALEYVQRSRQRQHVHKPDVTCGSQNAGTTVLSSASKCRCFQNALVTTATAEWYGLQGLIIIIIIIIIISNQSINQSINQFAGVATLEASARRTAKTHTSSPSSNDQRF
jgi:hypothetical protein